MAEVTDSEQESGAGLLDSTDDDDDDVGYSTTVVQSNAELFNSNSNRGSRGRGGGPSTAGATHSNYQYPTKPIVTFGAVANQSNVPMGSPVSKSHIEQIVTEKMNEQKVYYEGLINNITKAQNGEI